MGIFASITAVCDRCHKEKFAVDFETAWGERGVGDIAEEQAPAGWTVKGTAVCCERCQVLCSLCERPVDGDYRNAKFDIPTRFGTKTCVLCGACRHKIPQPPSR